MTRNHHDKIIQLYFFLISIIPYIPIILQVIKVDTKIQHNQLTATFSNPTNGNDENINLIFFLRRAFMS